MSKATDIGDDFSREPNSAPLVLRVLGPMELYAGGDRVALPRSKKCRALLSYLALTQRAHRRERLCAMLWDVADDPRGALRWTLSRIRAAISADVERIHADRESVTLRPAGMFVDACELNRIGTQDFAKLSIEELKSASELFQGQFLEGLELVDFLDFHAWCIAQREELRGYHCNILAQLATRLRSKPAEALPYALKRAHADAFNVDAQQELLHLLLAQGRVEEAEVRMEHARRMFREVSAPEFESLERAWRELNSTVTKSSRQEVTVRVAEVSENEVAYEGAPGPFVGRQALLERLLALVGESLASGELRIALISGEPGAGKSRVAEQIATRAGSEGFEVITARAFEAESNRPFGLWAEGLGVNLQDLVSTGGAADKYAMFDALRERLHAVASEKRGVLLTLDDLQWIDADSAEFLHYLLRTYDRGPLMVVLVARAGELSDNEAAMRALRSIRRENRMHEIELEPLEASDVAKLVSYLPEVDAQAIYEASSGNPLYALELARAYQGGRPGTSSTLLQLVRDRVSRLPDQAAEVLRWGAVLGHAVDPTRLSGLISLSDEELIDALERLERSGLLHIDAKRLRDRYVFAHDVIREVVYSELSHPRRRLMHRKVALLLERRATDLEVATEIAHHAGLAGEALLGVQACIAAGHHAIRVFANGDAETMAKRGLRLAEELEDDKRVEASLDLLHVQYTARRPDRQAAAEQVRRLAESALDLGLTRAARLGFQMLSYLRWESSDLAGAHQRILQAERVSRSADPSERSVALAQAAKCLVLLERNFNQAEAFVLEAGTVASREGVSSAAVSFALGMIAAHRGEYAAASEAFVESQLLAHQRGERLAEFSALEHRVMLELNQENYGCAASLAEELADIGTRVRPGAEVFTARALFALSQVLKDSRQDYDELSEAVDALEQADAKYELAFVLIHWAFHLLAQSRLEDAKAHAERALNVATAMGRASDIAMAHAVLARVARERGAKGDFQQHVDAIETLQSNELSMFCRMRVEALLSTKTS